MGGVIRPDGRGLREWSMLSAYRPQHRPAHFGALVAAIKKHQAVFADRLVRGRMCRAATAFHRKGHHYPRDHLSIDTTGDKIIGNLQVSAIEFHHAERVLPFLSQTPRLIQR